MSKEEEKLKKFLASDDTAMRRAGLALAKAIEIPTTTYKDILALALWDPEEENRITAKELIDSDWSDWAKQPDIHPTIAGFGDSYTFFEYEKDSEAMKIMDNISEFPDWLEPFGINGYVMLDIETKYYIFHDAVKILSIIADARVVNPLIQALDCRPTGIQGIAFDALSKIGDTRAFEPILDHFINFNETAVSEGDCEYCYDYSEYDEDDPHDLHWCGNLASYEGALHKMITPEGLDLLINEYLRERVNHGWDVGFEGGYDMVQDYAFRALEEFADTRARKILKKELKRLNEKMEFPPPNARGAPKIYEEFNFKTGKK